MFYAEISCSVYYPIEIDTHKEIVIWLPEDTNFAP